MNMKLFRVSTTVSRDETYIKQQAIDIAKLKLKTQLHELVNNIIDESILHDKYIASERGAMTYYINLGVERNDNNN
jgi:hypothetical protein